MAQRTLNDRGTGLAASSSVVVVGGPKWLASSAKRQLGGVHGRGRTLPCALHVVHQERPVLADHDQVELYRVDVWVERHVRDTTIVYELADNAHRARRWILAPTKGVDRSGADGIRAGHCGVGLQMTRTKYFRRKVERIGDYAARTYAVYRRPDLEEAVTKLVLVPGNDLHLTCIARWAAQLAAVLHERSWFVVRASAGQFITSDNPVYGIAGWTDALDVGVLAASEIRYPVDPRTALVWTPEPGHDATILFREREVVTFNAATFANAYGHVYAHPNEKDGLGRLVKHPDSLIDRLNATVKAPNSRGPARVDSIRPPPFTNKPSCRDRRSRGRPGDQAASQMTQPGQLLGHSHHSPGTFDPIIGQRTGKTPGDHIRRRKGIRLIR